MSVELLILSYFFLKFNPFSINFYSQYSGHGNRKEDKIRKEALQFFTEENYLQMRILVRAREVRTHLSGMLKEFCPKGTPFASCGEDNITLRKCLISGYFSNVAKLSSNGQYRTVRGNVSVSTHPNSVFSR